jgi:hypothetical protein
VHLILGYLIVILDPKKESVDTTKSYFLCLGRIFFDVNQVVCELIISPTIVSYGSKICELPSLLLCFCQKLEEKTK